MKKIHYRYQRTLAQPASVQGMGYLTGQTVHLCFRPALPASGVVFIRTDLRGRPSIPATVDQVTGTERRTTLGRPPQHVGLVEHVLAALAGLRIDNCIIEMDGPEPPGLDGSAQGFVDALQTAGILSQETQRPIWTVDTPTIVSQHGASLAIHPGNDGLRISYFLDYGAASPIVRQQHSILVTPQNFVNDLAACRTFVLESEAAELRRQGYGLRVTAADLLVFGCRGVIENKVRFADEPARHKILDLVGDLSLFGHDLWGHVVAYRSGHPLNVELARTLQRQLAAESPTMPTQLRCAA